MSVRDGFIVSGLLLWITGGVCLLIGFWPFGKSDYIRVRDLPIGVPMTPDEAARSYVPLTQNNLNK